MSCAHVRGVVVALTIFGATPVAQTDARLLGLTSVTPRMQSLDVGTCQASDCLVQGLAAIGTPHAGGAAYDTRTRGTWITDGDTIRKVDSRNNCAYQCFAQPVPAASTGGVATGLAYEHGRDRLWLAHSTNAVFTLQIQDCGLQVLARCDLPVPPASVVTGLAIDDLGRRLLYGHTPRIGPAIGQNMIVVASLDDPCQPICVVTIGLCADGSRFGRLTGLAYDACDDRVWFTDGILCGSARLGGSASCTLSAITCCANPTPLDPYVGLCIEPSTEASLGQPCSTPACPSCAPVHFLGSGDPVLANQAFSLDAANLPANSVAVTFLNLGACGSGALVPLFCGPLRVPLGSAPLTFSTPTGGTVGCTGRIALTVSIQPDVSVCGLVLSSQVVGLCAVPWSVDVGSFMSNCLSWRVTSS